MSASLFRHEAIDHQRFRIWGEVAIALPNSYAMVTSFIALSVVAMALFIATHDYARKEHAAGFLVASEAPGSRRRATARSLRFTSARVSTSSAGRRC
jgi:hypothetical protein